ncbi:oligosaccharide flippase family protein [Sphingobacterium ginsenosidimutans]|uniref:oligosaccharide flippase family protein n=1 Tax=Sphingobacterium ginsenosidimutans TaxID=687845 RepID=UPI0031F75250
MLRTIKEKILTIVVDNSFVKNSLIFTLFATINNGLNFLLIFLLSGYLSKQAFGELNLFSTILLVFTTIIPLGTQGYISVIYYKKNKKYINRIMNTIISLSLIVFLLFSFLFYLLPSSITNYMSIPLEYVYCAIAICFFQVIYLMLLEVFRLEEKPVKYGLLTMTFVGLNIGLTWYLCVQRNYGWEGRALAQFISSIICFGISIYYLRQLGFYIGFNVNRNHLKRITRFGLPLIPHSSTVWLRMGLDRYIINFFQGSSILGSFSFIFNFSGLILMVGTAFNASNSVFIFKNLTSGSPNISVKLKKQVLIMTIAFAVITVISMVVIYGIIKLFMPKYIDAIPYIFPLCAAAFFQCIYYLFVNYIFYYKKTKELMYITFSISIIHVILSICITRYTVVGLAYLNLLSNFIICSCVIYYSNKLYPILRKQNINE